MEEGIEKGDNGTNETEGPKANTEVEDEFKLQQNGAKKSPGDPSNPTKAHSTDDFQDYLKS